MKILKAIKLKEKTLLSALIFVLLTLVSLSQAEASTVTSEQDYDGSSHTKNITIAPDSEVYFVVDGILAHRYTIWRLDGTYKQTDESKLSNGYADPEYYVPFGCTGSFEITATITDGDDTYICTHRWNVSVSGDCSSGDCCSSCYYKSSGAQPTGLSDYYYCEGSSSATSTSYVKKRDYKCTGSSSSSTYTDSTVDTCGTCEYCTYQDSSCNYYSSSTVCESNADVEYDCDGSACGADVIRRYRDKTCSGSSSSCNNWDSWKSWATADNCSSSEICVAGNSSCSQATSHASYQCSGVDVYYYDACGSKEEKKDDCGENDYSSSKYCYDNDVYQDYVTRGCSGNACTESTSKEKQEDCGSNGCESGSCKDAPDDDCTNGVCCDTSSNEYRENTYVCDDEVEEEFDCEEGCGADALHRYKVQYCSGNSSECTGNNEWLDWEMLEECDSDSVCTFGDTYAKCTECPEGCNEEIGECNAVSCSAGECCNTASGEVYSLSTQCADKSSDNYEEYRCDSDDACGATLDVKYYEYYCDGVNEDCPNEPIESDWQTVEQCEATELCSKVLQKCVEDSSCAESNTDGDENSSDDNNDNNGNDNNDNNDTSDGDVLNSDGDNSSSVYGASGCNGAGGGNNSFVFLLLVILCTFTRRIMHKNT